MKKTNLSAKTIIKADNRSELIASRPPKDLDFSIKFKASEKRPTKKLPTREKSRPGSFYPSQINPSAYSTGRKDKTYGEPLKLALKAVSRLSLAAKLALVAAVGIVSAFAPAAFSDLSHSNSKVTSVFVASAWGDGLIDMWWPTQNASMTGTQPFQAILKNYNVADYHMYWQVDGGQFNEMYNSNQNYPHKQYDVDLSGWTWKGSGPYTLTFTAKDNSGNVLAQQYVTIYVNGQPTPVVATNTTTNTSNTTSTASTTTTAPQPTLTNLVTTASAATTPAPLTATTQAAPTAAPAQQPVDVWWPTNNASVSGTQPFKVLLENSAISNYNMYWQVDDGQQNLMNNSYQDYPHKESLVDLSGWSWHPNIPYKITFTAKNSSGQVIGQTSVNINVYGQTSVSTASPTISTTSVNATPAALSSSPASNNSGNPLAGAKLYVNPYSDPANWANSHRSSDPYDASLMDKVASGAEVEWFGNWNSDVRSDVNNTVTAVTNTGAMPVLVAYNIPNRDCGGYSAGGTSNASDYSNWIHAFAAGIGNRKAAVILEPDALSLTSCLSSSDLQARYGMLKNAVSVLKQNPNTAVYIDAGHPGWIAAGDMASRLNQAGIGQADGFSLNIANFNTTADNVSYGQSISSQVGGKHFVIDTGRNGSGPTPDYQWCNPSGRALGQKPTTSTGSTLVDAYLWIKGPGGSDGYCNGGPAAGVFWPDYALGLAKLASW